MAGPPTFSQYKPTVNKPAEQKGTKDAAALIGEYLSNEQKSQNIKTDTATAPYAGPKAEAELKNARLQSVRDAQTYGRDLRKDFAADVSVKDYRKSMEFYTTALSTPHTKAGDGDLVVLAVKVQDPTGAVMENDIGRYKEIQQAADRFLQPFRNELMRSGALSPAARRDIRQFILNRVLIQRAAYEDTRNSYTKDIENFNAQSGELGVKPLDVTSILLTHPATLYSDKILAYDKKEKADAIRAEREAGGPTADLLAGVPEGAQIAGQDIQGWRFSPEAEVELNAISTSPEGTPEAFATLLADRAVSEGHVPPSQRDDYYQKALLDNQEFFKQTAEQRAAPMPIDYSGVDKAASENAGLIDTVAQSGRNLPESGMQVLGGSAALTKDAALSILTGERMGTVKTFTDLAAELGQGQFDGPTVTAMADAMKERYGGWDALQRTLIKDPLGLASDLSVFVTGGGSALARAPGAIGAIGEGVTKFGKFMDPLSGGIGLVTEGMPALYTAAKNRAPGFAAGFENLPSEIVAFPSGVGGASVREGFGAGVERGAAGVPTPRSKAFTTGMREPESVGGDLITAARSAVANLRDAASTRYTAAMAQFGQNPTPLSIDSVRQRMQKIKPKSYDTWSDRKGPRPSEHLAWEQMNDLVEDYASKAATDPNLLMPLAVDQFKQDLFDVGSKIGGAYDRDASRIAGSAYSAVRQELVNHDKFYGDIMRDYEKAAVEANQLESSFGLAAARGKQPNIDSSTRKLQAAIGRNNANVNYGQRAGQVERLNELDPDGTIIPTLAGATLSSFKPRGLNAAVTLGAGIPAALTNPLALLAAPAFMPRVMGELAYGAGATAGLGKRGLDAITGSPVGQRIAATGSDLAELYNKYPQLFLAQAQLGTKLQETEQERLERLYASNTPSIPANASFEGYTPPEMSSPAAPAMAAPTRPAPAAVAEVAAPIPEEGVVMYNGKRIKYDPATDTYVELETGRRVKELTDLSIPVEAMYRGGLMALADRYR